MTVDYKDLIENSIDTDMNDKLNKIVSLRTKELEKVIERYDFSVKGSNDGLWDWDLQSDEVYYSPKWKSMLGYEDKELENTISTWSKLVHLEDKDSVLKKVKDCIDGKKEEFEAEMKMHHKDGSTIIVLSRAFLVKSKQDGKPIRLVGTHVDISQRKKSERLIKETNKVLEMIAMGSPANEVYEQIAFMYESRHPGMRCSLLELEDGKLLHGGAPSMPKEYCDAVNGLEIGPNVGSCGASTYTGKRVLVENIETDFNWTNIKNVALPHGMRCCWSEPILNSRGKVLGAFGMYYNYPALPNEEESEDLISAARLAGIVMERDQSQKQMQKDEKIISEQSKLVSMGEMIGNIAHQWRQPLSVITTTATSLKIQKEIGVLNNNDINRYMDTINESAQYLSQTIEDFRNFLDPKNSKLKEFLIPKAIDKTLKIVSSQFVANDIKIIKDIENRTISSFENELIQVLINLLNNSRDALLNFDNNKKLIFINAYTKDDTFFIEVIDNAGGVKKDIVSRIFEPYFTTKYKSKGTGIGLYMSQDIVSKLLNGDISMENTIYKYENIEYKGAKFKISIGLD